MGPLLFFFLMFKLTLQESRMCVCVCVCVWEGGLNGTYAQPAIVSLVLRSTYVTAADELQC